MKQRRFGAGNALHGQQAFVLLSTCNRTTVTGIREGEKLHELMIGPEDARHTREFHDHYMVIPEIYSHDPQKLERFLAGRQGASLPDGFSYSSNTNQEWVGCTGDQSLPKQS